MDSKRIPRLNGKALVSVFPKRVTNALKVTPSSAKSLISTYSIFFFWGVGGGREKGWGLISFFCL